MSAIFRYYLPREILDARCLTFCQISEASTKKTEFENEKNGLPKNNWINTIARRNPYKFMCKTVTSHYVVLFPWCLLHPFVIAAFSIQQNPPQPPTAP